MMADEDLDELKKELLELRLRARADALENVNYHSECEIIRKLARAYELGEFKSAEDVLNYLSEMDFD